MVASGATPPTGTSPSPWTAPAPRSFSPTGSSRSRWLGPINATLTPEYNDRTNALRADLRSAMPLTIPVQARMSSLVPTTVDGGPGHTLARVALALLATPENRLAATALADRG